MKKKLTLPEIEPRRSKNKPFDVMKTLRKEWNKSETSNFIDCTVPPTVFWCAETSNFVLCKFIEGEAFESDAPTEVHAYVAQTSGDAPHKVCAAKPAARASLKVVYAERPFPSFRFPARPPIPELREGSKYGQLYTSKKR